MRTPQGYGRATYDGFVQQAHRVMWTVHKGKIPKGLIVCHRCDNPPCINPDHLWVGTHQDNVNDKYNKGRAGMEKFRGRSLPSAHLAVLRAGWRKRRIVTLKKHIARDTKLLVKLLRQEK